jgi:DNA-binding CsgD family transcriptional regulator
VLAIVGEPGIGKTTLWQEGVALARAKGATILVARPTEAEARLTFAGLADLLVDVPDELFGRLPAPQRIGLDAALLRATSARPPERRVVAAGFLTLLRALAAEAPVVCAIDDVHWLDAPTATVVEFALRRLGDEPMRGLFSLRTGELARSPLPALERDGEVQKLELGPLSVGALHRIIAQTLGHSLPRPTLVRIAQLAAGNPLYALEIARKLGRDRSAEASGHVPVPDSLQSLVRARVHVLSASTREALLRAAILARPDTRALEPNTLAAAEEAGLVRVEADGRIHFVHPLFASAVYAAASAVGRRKAHRAVAGLVHDPEERARNLALGSAGPDVAVVSELEAAARQARRRGAPDAAAELTGLALRLLPEGAAARPSLEVELAGHLHLAGDFAAAQGHLEGLRQSLDRGDLRAQALLTLAEIEFWGSGESAATALAEQALADADDRRLRARCLAAIAMYAGSVDLPKAVAAAREALALLDGLEDAYPGLVAAALSAGVRADLFLGAGFDRDTAMRALALEERDPPPAVDTRVVFKLSQWLRYVDDLDGARARLAQAERQAGDEGDESSLANILLNRVIVETWAGKWTKAEELAERMRDAFGQQGLDPKAHDLWRAYIDAHAGRVESVRVACAESGAREPMVQALWCRCLGLAELAVGETADADRHLSEALEVFDRVGFCEPAIWRVDGDAIEAALAGGDVERARRLVDRFEEHAARSRIAWSLAVSARCRGLLLAGCGDLEAAAETLDRALVEHERCPVAFERARTLLVHGQVLRRLKRRRQARASLEEAAALFHNLGAEPWASRVDAELRRVAVRRSPEGLTPTELRIAELAASGLSNPEIAARVFVSRKTVEANLARVYRKLGIRARAQLDRALSRDADVIS